MKNYTALIAESLVGKAVFHGSPYFETPETVESIEFNGNSACVSFVSGFFTFVNIADLQRLCRDGNADYTREGIGSLKGAFESIILA
jgi:hypothetical protein